MKAALCTLLLFCTSAQAVDAAPTPPPIIRCTIGDQSYACIKTVMGGTIYLAIFAKDGKSLIRVYEINRRGEQKPIYP